MQFKILYKVNANIPPISKSQISQTIKLPKYGILSHSIHKLSILIMRDNIIKNINFDKMKIISHNAKLTLFSSSEK